MKRFVHFFLFAFIALACSCQTKSEKVPGKPFVVTSIPPYAGLVREIVGDTMVVVAALSGSFDPHTSEPTPSQMKTVQDSDLFIGVGEGYEKKLLGAIREGKKQIPILEINEKIPLLSYSEDTSFINACAHNHNHDHSNHSKDLHFWLSTKSLALQVNVILEPLVDLLPENKALYEKNAAELLKRIEALDQTLEPKLKEYEGRSIIVSHAALGYFCDDFHLVQISIECEGKSPLPHTLTHILEEAEKSNAICVFTAPQFDNRGAELVAEKLNLRIESFDYLSEDVLQTIEHIADAIIQ